MQLLIANLNRKSHHLPTIGNNINLATISSCGPCRISLFLLTLFVVFSTWLAWKAVKAWNIKVNWQIMVGSYLCVIAFLAVRINNILPLDFLFGSIEVETFRRMMNEYFLLFCAADCCGDFNRIKFRLYIIKIIHSIIKFKCFFKSYKILNR